MFCPQCREQISVNSKFCRYCGIKIGYCPNCGSSIEFDSKFCSHCGTKIAEHAMERGVIEKPLTPKEIPPIEPEKVSEEHGDVDSSLKENISRSQPARSKLAEVVSGTRERLFKMTPEGRQVEDYIIAGLIDKIQEDKKFKSLDELKSEVIGQLKTKYQLSNDDLAYIDESVKKKGYTGRFKIDDVLAEKVGGRGRLTAIVAIMIPLIMFIAASTFGGVIEEVVVGKLINTAPIVEIQEPLNNIKVSYGQSLTFVGTSEDKEDEFLPGSSMQWKSSIDGDLKTGNSFSSDALSVGEHTITLTGADSKGKTISQSIVVKILSRGLLHELNLDKTVLVNGKEEKAYIKVWEPLINPEAPGKGWLEMENPFYKIKVNLDHSYYLLFDKINDEAIFLYNDKVDNIADKLTGSDIGFTDHSGENARTFSTTAIDDEDGIRRYQIMSEDKENGFLLVTTEGWDFLVADALTGYDAEAEVMFGLFADKPYFIDANEFNNLQSLGIVKDGLGYKNPDEIIKSWVMTGKYDSLVIKGGDMDHLNNEMWAPFYEVQVIPATGRKIWHDGSATFSKMFPTHKLIGAKFGGAIIFSLPEGKFRFDDSLGVYGEQVVNEFILGVEKPNKITAFTAETVNEYAFFYDTETFDYYNFSDETSKYYNYSMVKICERYGLTCPERPIDTHLWKTKRFAYVITLTKDWYNSEANQPNDDIYALADQGLTDFKKYENTILTQLEKTTPLAASKIVGVL